MLRPTKIHLAIGGLVETLGVHPELARQLKTAEFDHVGDTLLQAVDFINRADVL